ASVVILTGGRIQVAEQLDRLRHVEALAALRHKTANIAQRLLDRSFSSQRKSRLDGGIVEVNVGDDLITGDAAPRRLGNGFGRVLWASSRQGVPGGVQFCRFSSERVALYLFDRHGGLNARLRVRDAQRRAGGNLTAVDAGGLDDAVDA